MPPRVPAPPGEHQRGPLARRAVDGYHQQVAGYRFVERLSHKPPRNLVHQLVRGITDARPAEIVAQVGQRRQIDRLRDLLIPPSLSQ